MPANYVLLAEQTVSATVNSVTFTNIPQTGYTDLKIVASVRSDVGNLGDFIYFYLNSPGTGAYTQQFIRSDGSTPSAGTVATSYYPLQFVNGSGSTSNTFSNTEMYIPNYTGSGLKSFSVETVVENNGSGAWADIQAGLWNQTAAVTSITLNSGSGSYLRNSTFYLYGIAAFGVEPVIAPKATGGDIVKTDGTYWYHAFLSSGTFTPTVGLSCDVLVVAGGGGGGSGASSGGGGGAGGYRTSTGLATVASTNYAVTIGAGGTGGIGSAGAGQGTQGNNSIFSSITSTGGGFGSSTQAPSAITNGGAGGSGGGAGGYGGGLGTGFTGGAASPSGQGNAGGNGAPGPNNYQGGGGGGGAGAVGANAVTVTGGNGGAGLNTLSTWFSATGTGVSGYVAGGGGGGTNEVNTGYGLGGAGGGGRAGYWNGSSLTLPVAGTVNTGGGGGGAGSNGATGGAGGSGIVIVRYLMA
jgi:hypothetical protein